MRAGADIRPMRAEDAADVQALAARAFDMSPPADRAERARLDHRWRTRVAHLVRSDGEGAWVAEDSGRPVGAAMSLVRDRLVWGLSLLVVDPPDQERGVGRELFARALAHGGDAPGGIVIASPDPRALRLYARAGFALAPTLSASGPVDRNRLPAPDPRVRPGGSGDAPRTAAISREQRGASHADDIACAVEGGDRLLLLGDDGFVVHDRGSVRLLAARRDEDARTLLWAALSESDGSVPCDVNWMTAAQQWAVEVAVQAGLDLRVSGPLCVRGRLGPLRPYLPSGAYL